MNPKIIKTNDGSDSLISTIFGETYHSIHGAIQESTHVFINHALEYMAYRKDTINVFEMGFGTGLNAWLTLLYAEKYKIDINYHTVEEFPISIDTAKKLNYQSPNFDFDFFEKLHKIEWNKKISITSKFALSKFKENLLNLQLKEQFDVIYYDAFAPSAQPELWTTDVFRKLYLSMNDKGILTTYCAKGDVRRNLEKVGFTIERLEGPPGKREMLRAQKL